MKVLFVCNNAYNKGNGLSVSIHNTMRRLREHGVDARLMAVYNPDPAGPQPDFPLRHFKFPFFEPIIYANGFCFARIERKVIRRALEWADVVHIQEAMPLENVVVKMASKMGKTLTATFHLYPHNVSANPGLPKHNSSTGPCCTTGSASSSITARTSSARRRSSAITCRRRASKPACM